MKGRRRGLKIFLGLAVLMVAALAVLALTYAYWLPYVARPIGERFGVTFGKYERLEDGRFVLTEVARTNRLFDLRISRMEGFLPHVWKSRIGRTNETENFLEVNGWRVVVHEGGGQREEPRTDGERLSVYEEWKRAERWIAKAREWAPKATFLNGIVEHGRKEYGFSVITWDRGELDATGVWPISAVPIEIKGRFTGELPYQLSYGMHPLDLRARLRVMETNGLLRVEVAGFYKGNRGDVVANFGREGMLPLTATLKAADFKLPAEMFKLENYSEVTGSLAGEWGTNQYTLELKAHAEPYVSAGDLPPVDVDLAVRGDTNSARVERAVSTIPWLQLTVSDPLEFSYEGRMLSERSEIEVAAELEKIPKLNLGGRIEGRILLEKGGQFPSATFRAGGTNLSGFEIEAEALQLEGRLNWPALENFTANLRLGSNSTVSVNGSADLKAGALGETIVQAEGPMLTNLLPAGIRFDNIKLSATASGGLTNLRHAGELEVREFVAPGLQPLTIEASWEARQFTFENLALRARAGPASIFVSGSGFAGHGRTNFVVREMNFVKGDETYLALAAPSRVVLTTNAAAEGIAVEIQPLTLTGTGTNTGKNTNRQLEVSGGFVWPKVALLELRATNVNPSLFQFFVTRSLSGLDVEQLNVSAGWSNGPVVGSVAGRFSVAQEYLERLTASVDLRLETNGLTLKHASVRGPRAEIFRAEGFLPVSVDPLGTNKVRLAMREEIDFKAETAANEAFWKTIADLTKVSVSNATVRLSVQGTARQPAGELQVKAEGMEYLRTNRLPAIGPFEGRIVLSEQALSIPEFSARVEGQPVSFRGDLELGDHFWSRRHEEILAYALEHAELHLDAPEVNLAPFTEYFPAYLRPQGKLMVEASILPGGNLDGRIEVRGVETRPLPKVGVVQSIQADVSLRGREIQIENLSGMLGGETLSVGGTIDLSEESLSKTYPDLDFSIKGYNVPLARNPDVILRSDLDLRVRNGTNQIPVISGEANLRDSFLLSDITTLVPGRVARPERRPPYFTLPQDPLDEWLLEVRVRGENFMRVRSPFFQGVVSANFHVTGDLEEPVALGEAAITSGRVIFPFATLEVKQALVSLTVENPYLPNLFVVAAGRAFGFDIRMQAEGPAHEPVIEFSSVPSLTSEQIVLMLTTGQIPRQDFGFSTEDRAGKLAFFLGKSLWSKLHPNQPAEERLTIRSGEDVTEQGRQTYEVEYKLTDRWSLVGEYNRFGDLNANVKWRVFSR